MEEDLMTQESSRGLDSLTTYAKNQISLLFNQPKDENEIEIKLDVIGTETLEISSDVTEYYVEKNTWYNDNISIKPQVYRLQGEVGELYWYNKDPKQSYLGYVNQKLMPIAEFLPVRSAIGQQFMDKVSKIQSYAEVGFNLWDRFMEDKTPGLTRQQQFYVQLDGLFHTRVPFKVQTPWGFKTVALTSAILTQPERTTDRTQINITYKEFREAQMSDKPFKASDYRGRIEKALSPKENLGQQTGEFASFGYNIGKAYGVVK